MAVVLRIVCIITVAFCGSGCKTVKDLISWTPFWWVINRRQVEHPGTLRKQPPEVVTHNYHEDKKRYAFKLVNGVLLYMVGKGDTGTAGWKPLPGGNPRDCSGASLRVLRLAADNNRVFVLAENNCHQRSLWWYCLKKDETVWAKILIHAGGDFMKAGYAQWYDCAHRHDSVWVNLLALRTFVPYKEPRYRKVRTDAGKVEYRVAAFNAPRLSIDVNDIVDIAVGNWRGTVVTYYVLMGSTGKIMYIDEEIIMDRWKEVPNVVFRPDNNPYPLDSTARIAASNSVVAVYHHQRDTAFVSWIRWDFHNKQDFEYHPINWCETDWRRVVAPVRNADFFFFSSHWPDAERDTVWNTPRGIETKYNEIRKLLPDNLGLTMRKEDWRGCMATYNAAMISNYFCSMDLVKGDSLFTLREENITHSAIQKTSWKVQ